MVEKIFADNHDHKLPRILLFSDTHGSTLTFKAIPPINFCGLVAAEIRPQFFDLLQAIADERKVPFLIQPKYHSPLYPHFIEQLRNLAPDLIIVNSYSMLLRPEILSIPRLGAVNIHGALLPQYCECNPIQWILINNDYERPLEPKYPH